MWFAFAGTLPDSLGQQHVREEEVGGDSMPSGGFAISNEPVGLGVSHLGTQ